MATTVSETMQAFEQLSPGDQRAVHEKITAQIGDPSVKTTNNVWYIVVVTLAVIAVAALIGVIVLVAKDKSATVVASFGTLAIGGLIGIVAPSPVQSSG